MDINDIICGTTDFEKLKIIHDVHCNEYSRYIFKWINDYLPEYKGLFSIHRIRALSALYVEIKTDVETLIKFKDFLFQYDHEDFLESDHEDFLAIFSWKFFPFTTKDDITIDEKAFFLDFYNMKYIVAFQQLVNYLTILVDWKRGKLSKDNEDLVPFAKKEIPKIFDTFTKYGDVATEFLVRVMNYDFVGYNGNQKFIVTSSIDPNTEFKKEINDGYQIIRFSKLFFRDGATRENYHEMHTPKYIPQPMYYPLPDPYFPIQPGEEYKVLERRKKWAEAWKNKEETNDLSK